MTAKKFITVMLFLLSSLFIPSVLAVNVSVTVTSAPSAPAPVYKFFTNLIALGMTIGAISLTSSTFFGTSPEQKLEQMIKVFIVIVLVIVFAGWAISL
jgi:hypothetical protein